MPNMDPKTVRGFGDEWKKFAQTGLSAEERQSLFNLYFQRFPWSSLPECPVGFDLGCGSGRWAALVADRVATLHCIDPSFEALEVAKRNLSTKSNCVFHCASVDSMPLDDNTMDFGYSLGVLHHVPDTFAGIESCVRKLKPGAPFLLYLYYSFDNKPPWYRYVWKVTDIVRVFVSRLPTRLRFMISQAIAVTVYFPFARIARSLEAAGVNVEAIPLSSYRHRSFYTMRTDALDRFGTRLERRFSASQIREMMENAGLTRIDFCDSIYWCAIGYKQDNPNDVEEEY